MRTDSVPASWRTFLAALLLPLLCSCGGGGDGGAPSSASLAVAITGLPNGVAGAVTVTGPGAYTQTVNQSRTLANLAPGAYTVAAANVLDGGALLTAAPASQQIEVGAGANASAGVVYRPGAALQLALREVASGLISPVHLGAPAGDARQFVVERAGRIRVIDNGVLLEQPFLDIRNRTSSSEGERGLLSVAFHPRYASNGYFYIYYTNLDGAIVIERLKASSSSPNRADPASSLVLMTIAHPNYSNHYGGLVSFGTDGYLYIGTGDGGGAGDPSRNAQNTASLLGKLLRIDVDRVSPTLPYTIPANNPFSNQAGARPEIWAYGLRNPWRYAFDATQQRLYIADVGQNLLEEIDIVDASQGGLNFGWNIMEGSQCYNSTNCVRTGLTVPASEYGHGSDGGCSITGGYVYRGSAIAELAGRYLYSDYCGGWLRSLVYRDGAAADVHEWPVDDVGGIVSFGQDGSNELYLLNAKGSVYRIERK